MNEFTVDGLDKSKKLLIIRSTLPKKEFAKGGSMHGYQHKFGINYQTFTYAKLSLMRMTGITEKEYNEWDKKYNK